mgnify:CR=1 FL=1
MIIVVPELQVGRVAERVGRVGIGHGGGVGAVAAITDPALVPAPRVGRNFGAAVREVGLVVREVASIAVWALEPIDAIN